ncbi:hypothetical protein PUNSTDRAFT_146422 [Punctularia strigosozonata HHB-11173 SS5]|uniref:SAC3/GANP/THP3 conserved domain-containing protein n=1 Tax=Punctularia strigosozonata (strain HHB-11173) TaxID=741275 RepID=R7S201_PUNST|nr:uncharacterized protein PUNSTDRAFT_146422 [Punctularia strigosozonata HHB-11173 SS5]EIN04440.1 hypothetical protein PUNSTDRAFT_146422 [Punctularia strigosozonata HHB-11173 SS5]
MEATTTTHTRGRGGLRINGASRRPVSKNKHWVASHVAGNGADSERWERGGHHGSKHRTSRGGRGGRIQSGRASPVVNAPDVDEQVEGDGTDAEHGEEEEQVDELEHEVEDEHEVEPEEEPVLETIEEVKEYRKQLTKARELERKRAIAEGKMDDPLVPKRLEDAINMVGTCMDMCPRFERYVRWSENFLDKWELIPGTNKIDHKRAVKRYARAVGDQTIPSDLRPPPVLKKTLDYLFRDLLPRGGFSETHAFIRDRSRSVRNDFTIQHDCGPIAIECHDRCARFHILALYIKGNEQSFALQLQEEVRQLMYTLQSLKEFYEDQRGKYQSPTEVEMRVYHRLIHIRDQKERRDDIPPHILADPVFAIATRFRNAVQDASSPITKSSPLNFEPALDIFNELVAALAQRGNVGMIFLVVCILDHLGWKDVHDRVHFDGELDYPDIIDGTSPDVAASTGAAQDADEDGHDGEAEDAQEDDIVLTPVSAGEEGEDAEDAPAPATSAPAPAPASVFSAFGNNAPTSSPFSAAAPSSNNAFVPTAQAPAMSAFASLAQAQVPNAFGQTSAFGAAPPTSAFGINPTSAFRSTASTAFGAAPSAFSAAPAQPSFFSTKPASPEAKQSQAGSSSGFPPPAATPAVPLWGSPPTAATSSTSIFGSTGTKTEHDPQPSPAVNGTGISTTPILNPTAREFKPSPLKNSFQPPSADSTPPRTAVQNMFSTPPPEGSAPSFSTPPNGNMSFDQTTTGGVPLCQTPPAVSPFPTSQTPGSGTSAKPSPLKLDTSNLRGLFRKPTEIITQGPRTPLTPSQQPALGRRPPVSLPATPTGTLLENSFKQSSTMGSFLSFPKVASLSAANSTSGVLSPLVPSSPSTSKLPPPPLATPPALDLAKPKGALQLDPGTPSVSISEKAQGKQRAFDKDIAREEALAFERKGVLVKECFGRWKEKTIDRAEWKEACRRSDDYNKKVQRDRMSVSASSRQVTPAFSTTSSRTSPKRQPRKRTKSAYKPRLSDAQLAEVLKESKLENQRRWAEGTFLESARAVVKGKMSEADVAAISPIWRIWLSTNPANDSTAIWVEKKLDVPNSGDWVSEAIFSISLAPDAASSSSVEESPGLIIFECTPPDPSDDIEQRYQALDDCTRLRDLLESLSPARRIVPSLVLIHWGETPDIPEVLTSQINRWIELRVIKSYTTIETRTSMKDVDGRFRTALESLDMDVQCSLARRLTVEGVFKALAEPVKDYSGDWLARCSASDNYHWTLYGQLLKTYVDLLAVTAHSVLDICGNAPPSDVLPVISIDSLRDSGTAYNTLISWLSSPPLAHIASQLLADLRNRNASGEDFPKERVFDDICKLVVALVETFSKNCTEMFVPKASLSAALREMRPAIEVQSTALREFAATHSPPIVTPKRPAPEPESTIPDHKRFKSGPAGTPSASPIADLKVHARSSTTTYSNGTTTSPSTSMPSSATFTSEESRPAVTVAMLRELTKNMKRKYAAT